MQLATLLSAMPCSRLTSTSTVCSSRRSAGKSFTPSKLSAVQCAGRPAACSSSLQAVKMSGRLTICLVLLRSISATCVMTRKPHKPAQVICMQRRDWKRLASFSCTSDAFSRQAADYYIAGSHIAISKVAACATWMCQSWATHAAKVSLRSRAASCTIGKGLRQRDTSSTYLQRVLLWGGKTRGRDRLGGWHLFNMIVHDLRTMETQMTQLSEQICLCNPDCNTVSHKGLLQ